MKSVVEAQNVKKRLTGTVLAIDNPGDIVLPQVTEEGFVTTSSSK
jgi:hypothetical protein